MKYPDRKLVFGDAIFEHLEVIESVNDQQDVPGDHCARHGSKPASR
jgi:hypothetical protein